MTGSKPGFAVAAFLFASSTVYVGGRELGFVQLDLTSPARQFEILAGGGPDPGYSLLSEKIVLHACRGALTGVFGRLQPSALRAEVAENCAGIADRITSAAPTASYAHLVKALAEFERGDMAEVSESLVASRKTGPNEGWIAQARFDLAERGISSSALFTEAARIASAGDLAMLAQSDRGRRMLAGRYVRQPALRDRIAAVVETLPESEQRRFLSEVRARTRALGAGR